MFHMSMATEGTVYTSYHFDSSFILAGLIVTTKRSILVQNKMNKLVFIRNIYNLVKTFRIFSLNLFFSSLLSVFLLTFRSFRAVEVRLLETHLYVVNYFQQYVSITQEILDIRRTSERYPSVQTTI